MPEFTKEHAAFIEEFARDCVEGKDWKRRKDAAAALVASLTPKEWKPEDIGAATINGEYWHVVCNGLNWSGTEWRTDRPAYYSSHDAQVIRDTLRRERRFPEGKP